MFFLHFAKSSSTEGIRFWVFLVADLVIDWLFVLCLYGFGFVLGILGMDLPGVWTLIAVCDDDGRWVSVADALLLVQEARYLCERGDILMAQKRLESNRMGLLVKGVGSLDDVDRLRGLLLDNRSLVEITRITGWSYHKIRRIRDKARKDNRPLPLEGDDVLSERKARD